MSYGPPEGYDPSQYQQYDNNFNQEPDLTFNFDEAIEPVETPLIPEGPHPVCVVDTHFRYVGKDKNQQRTILVLDMIIEGENSEFEGMPIQDEWWMPSRPLQDAEKYAESLGVVKKRYFIMTGIDLQGTMRIVRENLIGGRAVVDVWHKRDKIEGQFDAQGKQRYYPPKMRIQRDYHPVQFSN